MDVTCTDPLVKVPFFLSEQNSTMTSSQISLRVHHPADSLFAEQLWNALFQARTSDRLHEVADLEDAAFRLYLPMARTLAQGINCDTAAERAAADQAAELGLANAVLGWQQSTTSGFWRFARATILRQLLNR